MPFSSSLPALPGREPELQVLAAALARAGDGEGSALAVRGEPGIGKTALLDAVARRAAQDGFAVVRLAGRPADRHVAFAGLDRIADALPREVAALAPALRRALGGDDASAAHVTVVAAAAGALLAEGSRERPMVLVLDDVQRLDRPTMTALAFAARRLTATRTLVLAATRAVDGEDGLRAAGWRELTLTGLSRTAATAMLDARGTALGAAARERVLDDAAGNPLALRELPTVLAPADVSTAAAVPYRLVTTARLREAFAPALDALPSDTRLLVRLAAADRAATLDELVRAASRLVPDLVVDRAAVLRPAIDAGILVRDGQAVLFRRSLAAGAVYATTPAPRRRALHAALAEVADDEHRRAGHRSAAAGVGGEDLAAELAAAARAAERRGDLRSASRATEHAARLATRPELLERGLAQAAGLALDGGEALRARALLDEAEHEPHGRRGARWVRERLDGAGPPDAAGLRTLAQAAEREAAAGAPDRALSLLVRAAEGFELGDPGPAARAALLTALDRVAAEADDLRRLAVLALAGPEAALPELAGLLARALARDPGGVPDAVLAGVVASRCGDDALAHRRLTTAAAGFAAHGVARLRAQALARRAWASIGLARWDEAATDAREAGRLAERTGQPLWAARAHAALALVTGSRGEGERSEALAGRAERLAVPLAGTAVLADVAWARGRTALADGRHAEALQHLSRLLDPADPAHHPGRVARALSDLAEAAVGAGEPEQAAAVAGARPGPAAGTAVAARAILLAADDVDAALDAARAIAPGTLTPFEWARLQLVLGALLRRARRGLESRRPLIAAEETFTALGAAPWAARARNELRASGQAPRRRGPESRDDLTPQELQIARLAATGLSNREIGQRLFLSPRTIGSHLYRVFPKLGVTSRVQLRDALFGGEALAA